MNLATAPNVVFHYFPHCSYFSSSFANFEKGIEIRLSLSPATPYSSASLPNHTKMFELVHVVTSIDDFGLRQVPFQQQQLSTGQGEECILLLLDVQHVLLGLSKGDTHRAGRFECDAVRARHCGPKLLCKFPG
jgi:hypothetical protein